MTAMGLLIVVLVVHLLQTFAVVLQQLLVAAFMVYLILPVHRWFVDHGVSSFLAFVLIVVLVLMAAIGLGQMIYYSLADLIANQQRYQTNLLQLIRQVGGAIPKPVTDLVLEFFNREEASIERRMSLLQTSLGTFFGFLSQALVVVVYLVFLLSERLNLPRRMEAGLTDDRARRIRDVVDRINASIEQYIAVKTWMSVLSGVLTTGVLWLFDVDHAVFWGIVAFLLNYIPYLGSIVATTMPVLLSLMQFANLALTLGLLVVLLAVQNGMGYFIEPRLAGSRLNLSPLVIILSLAFWGSLWGIVGMILAVPLMVVIKAILENIAETRPLAMLLSNQ
jgi:predicted PurR-regulated permease PerM